MFWSKSQNIIPPFLHSILSAGIPPLSAAVQTAYAEYTRAHKIAAGKVVADPEKPVTEWGKLGLLLKVTNA